MSILSACLLLAVTASPFTPAHAEGKKLYKWVDEKGEVHYSDTVPAQEAGKQRDILNTEGLTVDKVDRAKTPQEIAEEERRAAAKAALQKRIDEQAAHDRMLLTTYLSEGDLIHARDAKIQGVENTIAGLRTTLERQHQQLEGFMRRAADTELAGKKVSPDLVKKIQGVRDQIRGTRELIQQRRADQEAIRKEYAPELERYRKLKSGEIKPGTLPESAPAPAAEKAPSPGKP
jgi:hypothetical protein